MNDDNATTTPAAPEPTEPAAPRRATDRKPLMIAAATGVAGVVVGGVLGATLTSAGASDANQQQGPGTGQMRGGPGQMNGQLNGEGGQMGGPPGQQQGGISQQGQAPTTQDGSTT